MRLIDADALLSELNEEIQFDTPMYTDEQNKCVNIGLRIAIRDVKSAPTVDTKTEVARETIGYVEKHLRLKRKQIDIPFTSRDMRNYQCGAIDIIEYFEELVTELKNKYTKEGVESGLQSKEY